jgi:hypothetical protein
MSIQLEKLNAQLMSSYDPSNGDGRYFQQLSLIGDRQEQCQVVIRLHERTGLHECTAHRQIPDDSRAFDFCSFRGQP